MKLVQQYGHVWRLSDASYKKLLTAISERRDYDLDALGKCLGELGPNTLDMKPEEAKGLLK